MCWLVRPVEACCCRNYTVLVLFSAHWARKRSSENETALQFYHSPRSTGPELSFFSSGHIFNAFLTVCNDAVWDVETCSVMMFGFCFHAWKTASFFNLSFFFFFFFKFLAVLVPASRVRCPGSAAWGEINLQVSDKKERGTHTFTHSLSLTHTHTHTHTHSHHYWVSTCWGGNAGSMTLIV